MGLQGAQGGGVAHLHQRPVPQVGGKGFDTAVWTRVPQLLPEGTSKGDLIRSQHAERSNKLLHAACVPAQAPVSPLLGYWTESDQASESCTGKVLYYYVYFWRVIQTVGLYHLTVASRVPL